MTGITQSNIQESTNFVKRQAMTTYLDPGLSIPVHPRQTGSSTKLIPNRTNYTRMENLGKTKLLWC